MAKLLALWSLLAQSWRLLPDHFLPFLPIFDQAGSPAGFQRALQVIFLIAAVSLLFNYRVRTACLALGGVLAVGLLSSRIFFENNRTYTACLWLLAGLQPAGGRPVFLRCQVILLYFGAGLNKLLDADWRSGQFFENMAVGLGHQPVYIKLSTLLPALWFSKLMSWTVVGIELTMATALALRGFLGPVIWMGIAFHTIMSLVMRTTFGMFYCAVSASYLLFLEWPLPRLMVSCAPGTRVCGVLKRLDFNGLFEFREESGGGGLHLSVGDRVYRGVAAWYMALVYNPLTYFAFTAIMSFPTPLGFKFQGACCIVFLLFMSPALWAPRATGLECVSAPGGSMRRHGLTPAPPQA